MKVIAAPISGWLLDYFQSVSPRSMFRVHRFSKVGKEINLGYSVVFLVVSLFVSYYHVFIM